MIDPTDLFVALRNDKRLLSNYEVGIDCYFNGKKWIVPKGFTTHGISNIVVDHPEWCKGDILYNANTREIFKWKGHANDKQRD